jgi:hypothetical protein
MKTGNKDAGVKCANDIDSERYTFSSLVSSNKADIRKLSSQISDIDSYEKYSSKSDVWR